MKLKELPVSFLRQYKLRQLSPNNFSNINAPTVSAIVSLTTIPSRIHVVDLVIRSLLTQSVLPQKIILWINEALKDQLPTKLTSLQNDIFNIRFCSDTCSHRKLVHALNAFPNETIITCDDDLMYHRTWLERLWQSHKLNQKNIVAHECRLIQKDKTGKILPYATWSLAKKGETTINTLAIGYGGILYPVGSLHDDTCDESTYLKLAPKADDLWFKAMALKKGTQVRRSNSPNPKPLPIIRSQKIALGHTNIREDKNRTQWQTLADHFNF